MQLGLDLTLKVCFIRDKELRLRISALGNEARDEELERRHRPQLLPHPRG